MKNLLAVVAMIVSQQAMADGFTCQTVEGDLNIRLYNQTQPNAGTRSAAVMILSDANVGFGNKTIAKLSAEAATLSSDGTSYLGVVDLRRLSGGENIAGTKLQYVKHINVEVDFSYSNPVAHGTVLRGWMTIEKRDGSEFTEKLVCKRYLKGE